MIAALRDCSFYACPAGFVSNPRPPKYHIIADRPVTVDTGPACGYPLHTKETEIDARKVCYEDRCMRPGCRARWARLDKEPRHG